MATRTSTPHLIRNSVRTGLDLIAVGRELLTPASGYPDEHGITKIRIVGLPASREIRTNAALAESAGDEVSVRVEPDERLEQLTVELRPRTQRLAR